MGGGTGGARRRKSREEEVVATVHHGGMAAPRHVVAHLLPRPRAATHPQSMRSGVGSSELASGLVTDLPPGVRITNHRSLTSSVCSGAVIDLGHRHPILTSCLAVSTLD